MPPKNCGACSKLVFPMEELKCLDKTWHKACFKCQVCNMTLNMKNYKGYNKLPYCNAHYPQTKHTAVADTPENLRLAKNTQIQSSVKYHEEFEKARGQYTAVADDPETLRVRKNMQTISNVAYHGDMMRKQEMENVRPSEFEPEEAPRPQYQPPPPQQPQRSYQQPQAPTPQQQYRSRQPGSISDYDPMADNGPSPYSGRTQSTTVFASQPQQPPQQHHAPAPPQTHVPAARPPPQQAPPPQQTPRDPYAGKGRVSKALYDYAAADDDEVGFQEDDLIINCEPIDAGWMLGTVEKTGRHGMLPANYVEQLNW